MQRFDPLAVPLAGRQLIEASAGTGKTYSIALLYLRLVIETDLEVDNILVVTFTRSATGELRQRIRSRLREALDVLEMSVPGGIRCEDSLLAGLLERVPDPRQAGQRLKNSLVRMDESAIFTIHGFCQRILQDNAFESGVPFAMDFIESEQLLRRDIVRDFWRQRFYAAPAAEAAWAGATWGDPEGLAQVLKELLAQLEIVCIPEVPDEEVDRLRDSCGRKMQEVAASWKQYGDAVGEILHTDSCLSRDNRNGYGAARVAKALKGMEELAGSDGTPWILPDGVDLLAASVMAGRLKGKKIAPAHPFFDLFDEFCRLNGELRRLARINVLLTAYRFINSELEKRKKDRSEMYFNDLLTGLDRALAGPGGERLAQRIRERFAVALVDEFQDTDPLQYRIFDTLFGAGDGAGLFMIGDPKQSIYSFRGADVFAYIRAKKQTEKTATFTMDTNYRSTGPMVRTVNRLFDRDASFVFAEDISFSVVRAAGRADEEPFTVNCQVMEPLQAMFLPVADWATPGKDYIAKGNAERAAAQWTAQEIARLLHFGSIGEARIGDRNLSGGDVAVLVRTHREAEMVQRELAGRRIASVYYSQDSVFSSDEAGELYLVLAAILDLSFTSKVNAALVTGLFGRNALELELLRADAELWDEMIATLEEYHLCWRTRGVAAMVQKLMVEQRVVQRLQPNAGGERKLTNYLHLTELLQEASAAESGMEGLVRWYALQMHEPAESAASQQLRLESDENLVRIVTVHKAKGLEYPVVFLPFPWSRRNMREDDILSFHQRDTLDHIVDLGTGDQEHRIRAERERLAEDLRLLYVAVTRARYCCYFCWGRINEMERTALAWLLHRKGEPVPVFSELTEEVIAGDLADLNRDGNLLGNVPYPRKRDARYQETGAPDKALRARLFQGHIDFTWSISSYSRLLRTFEHANRTGEVEFAPVVKGEELQGRSVFTFPRGAAAGTCLHNILEQVDFAGFNASELEELVEGQLRLAGFESDWAPLLCRWMEDILQTPLESISGLRLRDLATGDRLAEMGFYFAMKDLHLAKLNRVLEDFGFERLTGGMEDMTGLMRGYIDLVFRFRDRYFLADYKSNHLGPSVADYSAGALDKAMREHRYDLQYLIYTVALHRYLAARMKGYDYSVHFGGVFYLFLRGMKPGHSSSNGVFFTVPPVELVSRLDACFGTMEAV